MSKQMRIRRGERLRPMPSHLCGDAVGHADRAARPVISASSKAPCGSADGRVHGDRPEQAELGEVERGLFLVGAGKPHQVIENLAQTDCGQHRVTVFEQRPYLVGGRLVPQVGDDRVRVENGQRRRSRTRRSCSRARSLVGPRPRYLPFSSSTGRSGTGRMTTRSPKSTTITRRVFHRARVSAGMETCPLRETVITWSVAAKASIV
jgi:hypothetical protein